MSFQILKQDRVESLYRAIASLEMQIQSAREEGLIEEVGGHLSTSDASCRELFVQKGELESELFWLGAATK